MHKLFLPLLLAAGSVYGQHHCFTTEMQNKWFAEHPEFKIKFELEQQKAAELDRQLYKKGYQIQSPMGKMAASDFTIPVVFHILHTGGSENISDAQVKDAVNILTRDFNCQNTDTNQVVAAFKNKIGNPKISFALATLDPNGKCTNGIIRYYDENTNWNNNMGNYKYTWPRQKYLNIYVVKSMGGGAAGYTYLPGTSIPASADAIVMLSNYVGSIGTSNNGVSRALTHEVGHWLNLPHTWGNTNNPGVACGDDGVSDTPITKGYTSCTLNNTKICNPGIEENIQNYMDYAYCQRMFTTGQSIRMVNAITSPVAGRNNLSTPANLSATGANGSTPACAPAVDIVSTSGTSVCAGQMLTFNSFTHTGNPSNYNWSGTNGAVVVGNPGAAAQFQFPVPGDAVVTLVVSNATGSGTSQVAVTVVDSEAEVKGNYSESFETDVLPTGWHKLDPSLPTHWALIPGISSHGISSIMIAGEEMAANTVRSLESPSYDFKNNPGATYTFKYAYRRATGSANDVLRIFASSDCGGTWQKVLEIPASQLALGSGGTGSDVFYPAAEEWKLYDKLTSSPAFFPYLSSPSVRLKYEFTVHKGGADGNRFYLDEINFTAPTGINEITASMALNVFPNPSRGAFDIAFTLSDASEMGYSISTIEGKIIHVSETQRFAPGSHRLRVEKTGELAHGMYLLKIQTPKGVVGKLIAVE